MSESRTPSGDKAALLKDLKIDRSAPAERSGGLTRWLLLAAVLIAAVFMVVTFGLPAATADGLEVRTAVARAASIGGATTDSVLDATGYVVARRQATVSSKTTGKVVEVLIEEGMVVEEGQLLARLDDSIPQAQRALSRSQLESARAGLAELEVQIRQAELDLERTRGLAARQLASQADLDRDSLSVDALIARLERARSDTVVAERGLAVQTQLLDDMQIRAPFAGVVIAKAAQPGEMISPVSAGGGFTRTGICTIVDMSSLEIEVDVNESFINRVEQGQPVQVTLNAYPQDRYPAEVIAIIPTADRNKATVRVRVGLLERDARVLPDMGVRVAFLDEQAEAPREPAPPEGVLVPSSALRTGELGAYVWVADGAQAERRRVTAGTNEGSRVRILSGLDQGERVIVEVDEDLDDALAGGANLLLDR